ncbi:MAG TPA: glycogen/starch/alpha-glucan phosphorylase [Polyangiaceae bacterium]|jgi:starch phosphorylase
MVSYPQTHGVDEKDISLGNDAASIARDFKAKLFFELAKFPGVATTNDCYLALSYVVRDRLLHRWVSSARSYLDGKHRTVVYLSAEYLMGPQLGHNVGNLGIEPAVRAAMSSIGLRYDALLEHEEEPGLGNGGLGRLAACYMDSLATLDRPAFGHGIRYEFGIFDQVIRDGWQVEVTDRWLRAGNPWEVRRFEIEHPVGFGGHVEQATDAAGKLQVRWIPERVVKGVPYDTPVLGYATANTNLLRLWSAVAVEEFDLDAFQHGDYWRAVVDKVRSENISKVLYPNDEGMAGKQLRLEQEYFFVSCALQDCIRILCQRATIHEFADKFAIQLNDTHPTLGVPELMRLLIDVHGLGWDEAWSITLRSFGYTNHTLMPEALETWPLSLFARLLPRHVEIVYEINRRFLDEVRARFPGDEARVARMSFVDERGEKAVRMAHVAVVGSHTVNGVAALHSRLLRETVLRDFAEMYPERFTNVTNGVTPRRFIALSNPRLATLIDQTLGVGWLRDLGRLAELRPLADDAAFREKFRAVKRANKTELAAWLASAHGFTVDPSTLFDAQCKRIHEYKRQHLAVLHVVSLYRRLLAGQTVTPRTFLFAGKAAPGYRMAKLMIRLIHGVAGALEADPKARGVLRVVFVPDFNVKNAQRIYPAVDLSEQISTAGFEASGTGNMKFAMNGALTIGTLDGANVEIRDAVGAADFFLFGMTADEVSALRARGYDPGKVAASDGELGEALAWIADGRFSGGDAGLFEPLVRSLREHDPFFVLADFRAYVDCQERVARAWARPDDWTRSAVRNVAGMGMFSSDRAIKEYAEEIWKVPAVGIARPNEHS